MQGKRNCNNIMGSITSSFSSATPGKKVRWVLKCLCVCRETIHTEYLGLLATKMLFSAQRLVTYATKIVQRKQKRLFDGNGMNSFSCKDTKNGAQLTLIDKNVI